MLQDYWDFSYTEMAIYDLPASLNLVHLQTGQKVHYIGYSQVRFTAIVITTTHVFMYMRN